MSDASSKFDVNIQGGTGIVVGDNNTIYMCFTGQDGKPRKVALLPISNLELESFQMGDVAASTFPYVTAPIQTVYTHTLQVLSEASDTTKRIKQGIIIFGESNAGKTRLALEALRRTLPTWFLLSWRPDYTKDNIPPPELLQERHLVLFLDDLQDYTLDQLQDANTQRPFAGPNIAVRTLTETLLQTSHVIIVATCRSENREQVQASLGSLLTKLTEISVPSFDPNTYDPLAQQTITAFKKQGDIHVEDWDGTLGSLVLGLSTKNREYLDLKIRNDPAATVLRAMKLLGRAYTRVHTERLLRSVCAHVFTEKRLLEDEHAWQEAVGLLLRIQFVKEEVDEDWETILAIRKDAYFERVVTDYPEPNRPFQLMKHLVGLREVFKDLKDGFALFGLSTSFNQLEQPKEELITAEEIIALDPNHLGGWMLKGRVLDRLQRHEEALAAFTRALDVDNRDAFLWHLKGISLASLQQHEEALIAFDRSLEIDPSDHVGYHGNRAWYYKGISLTLLKRYEEALVAFKHFHPDPNDIEYEFFKDLCTSRSTSQENERGAFGSVLNSLSYYEEVLCEQARIYGQDYSHQRAVVALQEKRKKLLVSIDQVLVLDAGDVQLWCLKGIVLYLMERYEEAIVTFNSALTLHPNVLVATGHGRWGLDAWYLKGISLCMLKRHEEALDAFDHSWAPMSLDSQITPFRFAFSDYVWAWFLKCVSIEKVKGREQALVAFEYVTDMFMRDYRRHPHPYLVSNDGTFKSISFQEQQKPDEEVAAQNDGIITSIDRIVALYPDDVLVWYYKGVMFYLMERYEDALVAFDRTLELDPYYLDARRSKAYSFIALGRYNEEMAEALLHVPNIFTQPIKGYSLSIWQRYLGAFDRDQMLDPDDESAWLELYRLVKDAHIQDPQIIREIANRFETLANNVEAAVKVNFDAGGAVQKLQKVADQLESLNIPLPDHEREAKWWLHGPEDDTSGESLMAGG